MSYLFDYVYHGESLKPSVRATAKQNKVSSNSHSSKVDASVSSQHSKVTSAVSEPHRVRRASVAVSVAAFIQKRTTVSVSELEDAESASRKHAPLINSKSESHIAKKADLTRRDSWKVALFVAKAKRKFSAEGDKLLTRRPSLSNYVKVAMLKRPEGNTRNILREMKRKAFVQKKTLLAKFKLAVRLTIFCSRNFKDHCLRINENNDELAPYIKRLHFHEEQNTDELLIDLSKFKANRQMRVPEIIKTILSKQQHERTEQELYQVVLALRNLKSLAEYPNRMQLKIAEVGLYEKYDSKRVIVRQNHPASAFYIILSGAVVVMVMEEDSKYARPVSHLYKGMTFGDLAIINGTKRQSTVICKETCEFLSISAQDYHKIFMAGGVKTLNDPDQEIFLKSLSCLADWPIHILSENPKKCQFLYFKNRDVIVRDSHFSDWLIIVKSGSVQVLKKLKRVEAFEWKKKKPVAQMTSKERRDVMLKRLEWRRFLPEMGVPMAETEEVEMLDNGRVAPFRHPEEEKQETPRRENSSSDTPRIPSLWPLKIDLSEMKSSSGPRLGHPGITAPAHRTFTEPERPADWKALVRKPKTPKIKSLVPPQRDRSASLAIEEEHELLGYQPHVRTIIEDIDAGIKLRDDSFIEEKDINPEFVHVQTLLKGQVFGLTDLIFGDQPSFSIISSGADCLLLDKNFYKEHASEKLLRDLRQELCPYPSEQELQDRLQISVDWQQYKKVTLLKSLEYVSSKRFMRNSLHGAKSQDAFVY